MHDTPLDTFMEPRSSDSEHNSNIPILPELPSIEIPENIDSAISEEPTIPIQRVSLRHKVQHSWMEDYVIPSIVPKANAILSKCPLDVHKYNLSHYAHTAAIFSCAVSKPTAIIEPHSYIRLSQIPVGLMLCTRSYLH